MSVVISKSYQHTAFIILVLRYVLAVYVENLKYQYNGYLDNKQNVNIHN